MKYQFVSGNYKIHINVLLSLKENVEPKMDIDLHHCDEYYSLSMSADIYERHNGRWKDVSWGQNSEWVRKILAENQFAQKMCDVWDRWNMNGLRAGNREQEKWIKNNIKCSSSYEEISAFLEQNQLFIIEKPLMNYKYGSAWLVEKIPEEIIKEIKSWEKLENALEIYI
jgi:hypothetical protein